jgi:hypothetical protein
MTTTIFVICAALGGTVLVCQLIMTLVGLGGDGMHLDAAGHVDGHFGGGDAGTDAGHGDAGTDVHVDQADQADQSAHHADSASIFRVLSFRTVVAAMTFFGLAGLAAEEAGAQTRTCLAVALGAGVVAMYAVYGAMRAMYQLRSEGTARIERAVGRQAIVYLHIPARNAGAGKIQIDLQDRTMEYLAVTDGEELPTGADVVVVAVINSETVAVRAVSPNT